MGGWESPLIHAKGRGRTDWDGWWSRGNWEVVYHRMGAGGGSNQEVGYHLRCKLMECLIIIKEKISPPQKKERKVITVITHLWTCVRVV